LTESGNGDRPKPTDTIGDDDAAPQRTRWRSVTADHSFENAKVIFRWRDYADSIGRKLVVLEAAEFVRRTSIVKDPLLRVFGEPAARPKSPVREETTPLRVTLHASKL
jgi:hypothetical protein